MVRVLLATLFLAVPHSDSAQSLAVLRIRVTVVDAEGKPAPVPRYVLLISDNPSTAVPRLVTTALDGTAEVKLRPGNYTVESDRPLIFNGKAYQWTQIVDMVAGRDAALDLTADNAEVTAATAASSAPGTPLEADPSFVLPPWQDSVVALWTSYTRATGFVVDARGLVATNQRVIGVATTVEVQVTPTVKVEGRVLASDRARDVALIWINPKVTTAVRPVPLGCAQATRPPFAPGEQVFTIVVPIRRPKEITSAKVEQVTWGTVLADFSIDPDSSGGPVFTPGGQLVGLTSVSDDDESSRGDVRIVPADQACAVVAAAEKKLEGTTPPAATLLPLEPQQVFPVDSLKNTVARRAGSLKPYQIASSDFDVSFITPVQVYGSQYQADLARERDRGKEAQTQDLTQFLTQRLTDFDSWSPYFSDIPPVLIVRVTPKMSESFLTTLARGAARTQGMAIPPLKRFRSSFSRLRAFCGDAEVTPIHPFKLELRLSETNVISEGLYVFDPGALSPQCGTVKLTLYSEKEPDKGDTRTVDAAVIQQVWQDFAPYRAERR